MNKKKRNISFQVLGAQIIVYCIFSLANYWFWCVLHDGFKLVWTAIFK
jgi:hypothetical protein